MYTIQIEFKIVFAKEEALKRLVAFKDQFCGDLSKREQWFVQFEAASRSSDKTELVDCIKKYCSFIGHKQCCYADLERWLPLVKEDEGTFREWVLTTSCHSGDYGVSDERLESDSVRCERRRFVEGCSAEDYRDSDLNCVGDSRE